MNYENDLEETVTLCDLLTISAELCEKVGGLSSSDSLSVSKFTLLSWENCE